MQAASQKAPASTRNARGSPWQASPVICGKASAPFALRASDKQSNGTRATGPRLPLVPPAESRQRPLPPQEGRRRQEIGTPPRFLHGSRESIPTKPWGSAPGVRREHFRETAAVDAGIRKDPSALRKGPSSWDARLAPLAFLRAAAPAQSPVGRPRSFKPPRPGPLRGRAAWRCDRSTAGSQAPPRRPGRSPGASFHSASRR